MALYWMEDGKKATSLLKTRKQFYTLIGNSLDEFGVSEDVLLNYIADVINAESEIDTDEKIFFRPGFVFSKKSIHWEIPRPLSRLWRLQPEGIGLDEENAGKYLGLLIYVYMIANEESWYCTKTSYNNRTFDTMIYWKHNG